MELSAFIAQTLTEIQKGVASAIEACAGTPGAINPVFGDSNSIGREHAQAVSFDIAVTVLDKSASAIGGGIRVVGLRLGADVSETAESSHVSRIQFSIPVIPPVQTVRASRE